MTSAEYQREWKRRNPERVKQYRMRYKIRQELKAEQAKQLPAVTLLCHELETHRLWRFIQVLAILAGIEFFGLVAVLMIGAF